MIEASFARLVADGEPYDLELGLVRADGERIWVRTIGRPVIEDGRVVRVGGHIADITERKRAEEELARPRGCSSAPSRQIGRSGGSAEYHLAPPGKLTWTDEVYRIYGSERSTHEL